MLLAGGLVVGVGCGAQPDDELEELEFREDTTARKGSSFGYINNGLHDPELSGLDPAYSLALQGLEGSRLDSPDRLATAVYAVECALPAGERVTKIVDGESVDSEGALGLAPEWAEGPCDTDCQEWVSACLLARTNVSEQEVELWLQADHPALGFDSSPDYPTYEASFFGNLFSGPDHEYVCPSSTLVGPLLAQLQGRTCSSAIGGCESSSYTGCELHRCSFVGLLQPTAVGCRAGLLPSGPRLNTISTYVAAPL